MRTNEEYEREMAKASPLKALIHSAFFVLGVHSLYKYSQLFSRLYDGTE
jgi:hypothetical protein